MTLIKHFPLYLTISLVLTLVPFSSQQQDQHISQQEANVLGGILEKYLKSKQLQTTYLQGMSQPVLFEPRPWVHPTAGAYTLLVIVPKAPIMTGMQRELTTLGYADAGLEGFRKQRIYTASTARVQQLEEKSMEREKRILAGRMRDMCEEFKLYLNHTFTHAHSAPPLQGLSENPYSRKKRDVPEKPIKEILDEAHWQRLDNILEALAAEEGINLQELPKNQTLHSRKKRFLSWIWSAGNSYAIHRSNKRISQLSRKVDILMANDMLLDGKVRHLAKHLDQTMVVAHKLTDRTDRLRQDITEMSRAAKQFEQRLGDHLRYMSEAAWRRSTMSIHREILREFEKVMERYRLWTTAMVTKRVTPQMIPPREMVTYMEEMEKQLQKHPKLRIPVEFREDIWSVYPLLRMTPYLLDDYIIVELEMPLQTTETELHLYRVHNLPAIDATSKLSVQYHLEGKYFAVTGDRQFVAVPDEMEVGQCEAMGQTVCHFRAPLYPREKCQMCLCTLYDDILEDQSERIQRSCLVSMKHALHKSAVYLEDNYWAVVTPTSFNIYVTCPTKTFYQKVESPLGFVNLTGGCSAQATDLFLPALTHIVTAMDFVSRESFLQQYQQLVETYQSLKVWDYFNLTTINWDRLINFRDEELPNLPERLPMDIINQKLNYFPPEKNEPWYKSFLTTIIIIAVVGAILLILGVVIYMTLLRGKVSLATLASKFGLKKAEKVVEVLEKILENQVQPSAPKQIPPAEERESAPGESDYEELPHRASRRRSSAASTMAQSSISDFNHYSSNPHLPDSKTSSSQTLHQRRRANSISGDHNSLRRNSRYEPQLEDQPHSLKPAGVYKYASYLAQKAHPLL